MKLYPSLMVLPHVAFGPKAETPMTMATKLATEYEGSMRHLDYTWLAKHSTPSMVFSSLNEGDQDRESVLVRLKTVYALAKGLKLASIKVATAKMTPEGLQVVTDTRMSFKLANNNGIDRSIELKTREQSVWTKRQGTWMVSSIKQLKDASTIDGRPLLFGFR